MSFYDVNIFDVWSVILRPVLNIFDLTNVILQCVFNIFDFTSVILRHVFNIFDQEVVIPYDVFVKSCHFVRVFEGHFSKSMCFFIGGTLRNQAFKSQRLNEYSTICESEP